MLSRRAFSILINSSQPLTSVNSCASSFWKEKCLFKSRTEVILQTTRGLSSFREKKRFYKRAGVEQSNGYQVTLDERKVKTPSRKPLVLPSKQLAMAVAAEWNMQKDVIETSNMNLTTLAYITIDKPNPRTKATQITEVLEFLCTDTVCFPASEPEDLVNLQKQEWEPIIAWFNARFNARFDVSVESFGNLLVPSIPKDTTSKLTSHLMTVNDWAMTGLEYAVDTSKSFIIGMALLENHINVEKAAYLSRLELEFQIGRWGSVEWAHDVDLMEIRSRLAAASLFYHLCNKEITS
ncbi:ATP synthase mitochondrial F1 complex assembly factor 2-like isoform X2 [Actinia tenebrosa]|uniref:ATP synthase mitochondrial F1 complex assembly factor 2-like isoform X2 n=1 Tax=Actinia tenebrosa TaxID=6105 RepID=A0A6P8IWS9_ACTTE|nr:ATP synthase mitochondrial F1 complex assembly factor 2-like isoform X2 [Actinia tenebrosa]